MSLGPGRPSGDSRITYRHAGILLALARLAYMAPTGRARTAILSYKQNLLLLAKHFLQCRPCTSSTGSSTVWHTES
ncbi:predicted protein [Pyrenophora tritici-repentis Pt-1C-BFP]|uniref:Uncharacterized protein n=1 Tax=Pyrenophora tritici-repentis (strain Pt-1C-BFP) TaxID=426418 RepID=B2W702_PYRTR|nr:uncharacterized protein PTRG_05590 [Pyrenophora tritici-repentis Pt-1C-BFP]EDU48510.1 predicted protein [Pyrenophora tritici-repentis Pt-1C-BFP]